MEARREKLRINPHISKRQALRIAALGLAVATVAGLCISISMYRHMHHRYVEARNDLGEAVYENLFMMLRRGDEISLAGVDVEGTILPAMWDYFQAGKALDQAVGTAFGARYAVLNEEHTRSLESAFDAYEAAFRGGKGTDAARSALTGALRQVEALLSQRFDAQGRLLPAS